MTTRLTVLYTNHRRETRERTIEPLRLYYGSRPPWHPHEALLLEAIDCETGELRTFDVEGGLRPLGAAPELAHWLDGYLQAVREAAWAMRNVRDPDGAALAWSYLEGLAARVGLTGLVPPRVTSPFRQNVEQKEGEPSCP